MIDILLVCGTGASSGFLAMNMKKSAQRNGIEIRVRARSDSVVDEYLAEADILLVGPHLNYLFEAIAEKACVYGIPAALVPKEIYSELDGAAALELVLRVLDEKR